MKAYLANGLSTLGDILVNELIASKIREAFPGIELHVPQEDKAFSDNNDFADSMMISNGDDCHLDKAEFLIAVIDGVEINSEVSCKIGSFAKSGKPVFALFTDTRQFGVNNQDKIDAFIEDPIENQFIYRNLYTIGKIKSSGGKIVSDIDELIFAIKEKPQYDLN